MVTAAQIKKIMPAALPAYVSVIVDNWHLADAAGIRGRRVVSMFFANVAVETFGLRRLDENLNYTTSRQLMKTWPKRFKTIASTKPYIKNPKALANFVYANRRDLGNRGGDDGWNMRGSGMLQTTGRYNFEKAGKALGLDFVGNPELLRDPLVAFKSAIHEWTTRGCNALAAADRLTDCRKAINGGTNGLADVRTYYRKALTVFVDLPEVEPAAVPAQPVAQRDLAPTPVVVPATVEIEPTATTAPVQPVVDAALVKLAQELLRARGYVEVGNADGIIGNRTAGAILSFENDNGLPLTGTVSTALVGALATAPHRPVAETRATATEADLKGAVGLDLGRYVKIAGVIGSLVGAIGSIADGTATIEDLEATADTVTTLQSLVVGVSPWVLLGIGGATAIYLGRRIIWDQVQKYRAGNHV